MSEAPVWVPRFFGYMRLNVAVLLEVPLRQVVILYLHCH